jgi:hypothetical protein
MTKKTIEEILAYHILGSMDDINALDKAFLEDNPETIAALEAPLVKVKNNTLQELSALIEEAIGVAPPCEENCSKERHAYFEGGYDAIEKIIANLKAAGFMLEEE